MDLLLERDAGESVRDALGGQLAIRQPLDLAASGLEGLLGARAERVVPLLLERCLVTQVGVVTGVELAREAEGAVVAARSSTAAACGSLRGRRAGALAVGRGIVGGTEAVGRESLDGMRARGWVRLAQHGEGIDDGGDSPAGKWCRVVASRRRAVGTSPP